MQASMQSGLQELRSHQINQGATFDPASDTPDHPSVPLSFGNDSEAYAALTSGVVLVDHSHWGLIQITDADRLRFLHNQTTNDFLKLQPGQGCDTVFVTSTARTIDLTTAYILSEAVWIVTSPGTHQQLMTWMDRYIFFADKVALTNLTPSSVTFTIMGPAADDLMRHCGAGGIVGRPYAHHGSVELVGTTVQVAVGSGLALPGYTLIAPVEEAADLWLLLTQAGAVPMGEHLWERVRIQQGRPMPGAELTDDYNPLEAGLWHTVSFSKGCYIGQETIARLQTYKGVKQNLWGLLLDAMPTGLDTQILPTPIPITVDGDRVGLLTSVIETPEGIRGLGYIRTKAGGVGLKVQVGSSQGTVIDVPFLTHE